MREIILEARAEIDVPAPETAEDGLGILVVVSPEFAGFAGIVCHRNRYVNLTLPQYRRP